MNSPLSFFPRLQRSLALGSVLGVLGTSAVLLPASAAFAQEFRGTISGAVTDATGAVVPGATVVVRETQTGTVNNTRSDNAGQYTVPFLLPGSYTVTVSMPGFQQVVRSGITLQSQEHPLINIALPVGENNTTVTVTDAAPLIDQANASVGQVISTESVEDLPLNGRTPTTFTELSEGVITTTPPQIIHPFDNSAGNSWSIGGTPNQVSEVLLDGAPDLTLLGALAYAPTQDSVQEVSVRPFDTDASEGHTIGGVINQITRGGTNGLHGSAYEFFQTAGLDANNYFNKRNTPVTPTPNAHFNQYGGTVGGPIVIPKLYNGRDKAFFFLALEGLRDSTPFSGSPYLTVPTLAERNGDFSQLLAAGCGNGTTTTGAYKENAAGAAICSNGSTSLNQLYSPYGGTLNAAGTSVTRKPIPNNNLNTIGAINPVAAAYLKLIPLPNITSTTPDGASNYFTTPPSIDTYSNEFGRLDFNLSSRDHIFGDFRHNHRTQIKNNYFGNDTTGTTLLRENYGSTIDNVFTLNPTTIIDTRVNWTFFNEVHGTPAQQYNAASVGLPPSLSTGTESQLPCILFGGNTINPVLGTTTCSTSSTTFQPLGDNTSALDPTTSYQVFTDVVKTIGKHSLKVGFDGRQYRLSVQNFGNSDGTLDFGSTFLTATNTSTQTIPFGGDLASFYLGLPSSGALDLNVRADYHSYYIGTFVQDDWRVSEKLTLNLGMRFDINTPFEEKMGKTVSGFNPLAPNAVSTAAAANYNKTPNAVVGPSINTLGGLTFPGSSNGAVFNTNNGFFSPRVGFSFSPNSRNVLRGGFGIFVQPETLQSIASTGVTSSNAISNNPGFSATTSFSANNPVTPTNTLTNPFPTGFSTPVGSSLGASTGLGMTESFLAPNQHEIYSERYDVGVQHSLSNSTLLEVLYVGNHSLHLPVASQNINAVLPQYLSTGPYRNQNLATAYAASTANPFAGLLPGSSFNGATTTLSNLLVRYPQFGSSAINEQNQTIGQSYFNSAILHVEQRARHGLTLTANYSFSKLLEADTFLNDEDTQVNRRISPFDHTHHFTVGATYELPFGRGKAFAFGGSRLADEILGGFVINSIYQFQTGAPILFSADIPLAPGATIQSITNAHRNTSPTGSGTPALTVSQFVTGSSTTCPVTNGCNGNLFINGQYTFHERTLPQTISNVRSDGFNNLDASLLKDIHVTEKIYFQLRFEAFNALNHAVFAAPNVSSATASNFGYITGVIANSQPRQVQLGGRFVF